MGVDKHMETASDICCFAATFYCFLLYGGKLLLWPDSESVGKGGRAAERRARKQGKSEEEIKEIHRKLSRSNGLLIVIGCSCILLTSAYGVDLLRLAVIAWSGLIGGLIVLKLGMMGMAKKRQANIEGEP